MRSHLQDEHFVISLCHSGLLSQLWALLKNKNYVEVCTDGIYRLSEQQFAVISLGFLAKACSSRQSWKEAEGATHCFPTSFKECMLSIVSTEHHTTYGRVFMDLDMTMREVNNVENFYQQVGQVHGDYHKGLHIARSKHYRRANSRAQDPDCFGFELVSALSGLESSCRSTL